MVERGLIALVSLLVFVLCLHYARTRAMERAETGVLCLVLGGLAVAVFVSAVLAMAFTVLE